MNLLLENLPWIQALGWSLVHFLWQGLLIGALFALARSLVSAEHSSIRYAVGLLAMAMLAVCPVLTLWVLWPQAGGATARIGETMVVASASLQSGSMVDAGSTVADLLPLLVLVWLAGVAFMIWRGVHQWRALRRIATLLAFRSKEIEELLLRVAQRFGGIPSARVLVSGFIDTPTLIGWFKPVILLPAAVVTGFPREQLELILAHELGHLRRYDHLVNLGQAIVETLLFYHPVVHWISREVRHEREICCDNLVLRLTDSEPREYARTLAALETVRQLTPQLAVAASGGILLDRVRRIIGAQHRPRSSGRSSLGTWLVTAVGATVIIGAVMMSRPGNDDADAVFDQPARSSSAPLAPLGDLLPDTGAPTPVKFAALAMPAPDAGDESASAAVSTSIIEPPAQAAVEPEAQRVVAAVAAPSREIAASEDAAALVVADLALPAVRNDIELAATVRQAPAMPTILRMVSPDYPDRGNGPASVKVGFEFGIDDAGKVHDIRVISGNMHSGFAEAARRALRQWRFDPGSLQAGSGEKYRQDFEFVSGSQQYVSDDSICTPPTGTHVCRSGRFGNASSRGDEERETMSQTIVLAGGGTH